MILSIFWISLDLEYGMATMQSIDYKHTVSLAHKPKHSIHIMSITKPAI